MLKTVISMAWPGLAAVFLLAAGAAPARADVFFTVRDLLAAQFKTSERVTHVKVRPSSEQRQRIQRRLGRELTRDEYTFYVATSGSRVDGYALFDDERGQHEPISFATFFDAQGNVTRVEIVAYREPYGDGIRGERFRRQFVGKNAYSRFRPEHEVDAISGATISSRSMCVGVERASVLLSETLLHQKTLLASR
jgi:Na+-translocating ferredoxin:NAD+ oxidoreductase RnfG subunit